MTSGCHADEERGTVGVSTRRVERGAGGDVCEEVGDAGAGFEVLKVLSARLVCGFGVLDFWEESLSEKVKEVVYVGSVVLGTAHNCIGATLDGIYTTC